MSFFKKIFKKRGVKTAKLPNDLSLATVAINRDRERMKEKFAKALEEASFFLSGEGGSSSSDGFLSHANLQKPEYILALAEKLIKLDTKRQAGGYSITPDSTSRQA